MHRTHILAAIALCAACTAPDRSETRRRFVAKASRALHPSAPPLAAADIDALLASSDDDIVAQLYAAPATRDAVFALSLAFVGAPIDELHAGGGAWAEAPFLYAPAAAAARAFATGGDPLASLLAAKAQSVRGVATPVRDDLVAMYLGRPPVTGTNAQRRAYVASYVAADLVSLRAAVAAMPDPFDTQAMCTRYQQSLAQFVAYYIPDVLGVPQPITMAGYPTELADPDSLPLDYACPFGMPVVPTTKLAALGHLDHAKMLFDGLFARLEPIFTAWEAAPDGAFDPVDFTAMGFVSYADSTYYARTHFYPQLWQNLQNSSTNFDRRRGAYVLDRFFCDDLRPIGAALPDTHAAGKHASDPGCAACHFKLDPMAGFFRRHGYLGTEFSDATLGYSSGMITFDDFATAAFTTYDAAWKAPDGSGRSYDVGFIRSTRDASLNTYGSTLDDLDTLLATAPEAQRCFAQRVFEYFNGADQAVDPGYLDDVASDVQAHAGDRLQRSVVRVLTGETFRAADRNSTVCYDLAPGADLAHRPPCEVASILRASCTSCHGGGNPQAGLDLSSWQSLDGGFGFKHVVGGQQVPRLVTFQRMHDRVTTSDVAVQMPQGKDMPLHSREQLAVWVQKQLGK
jgi:hypothetical protein